MIGGTGPEGRGVALRLARGGATVVVGSRAIDRARQTVDRLRERAGELPLDAADNRTVADRCDVVFLTVPFAHAAAIVGECAERFRPGSLLIDVTVPVTFDGGAPQLVEVAEGSAAEHIRGRLPRRVQLAAALKTVPARVLGGDAPLDCDEFVCGDSAEARSRAGDVLRLIPGLRLIDAGPLAAARTIERMTLLAIEINRRYKVRDARFRVVGV